MSNDGHRNRRNWPVPLALMALFLLPVLVAVWINRSGHLPEPTRQHGELLQPPADLRAFVSRFESGGGSAQKPAERRWRVVVAPPSDCGDPCRELARELDLVWRLLGSKADGLDIFWLGAPPADATRNPATHVLRRDPALRAQLPRVDDPAGVPVYVVDPNGFVILRYAPGFDPGGLRADLAKLLRLM